MPGPLATDLVIVGAAPSVKLKDITLDEKVGHKDHSLLVSIVDANASITVLVVDIEECIDGDNVADGDCHWTQMVRHPFSVGELTAKHAKFDVFNSIARRLRVNIITLTGGDGSTDKITVLYQEGLN